MFCNTMIITLPQKKGHFSRVAKLPAKLHQKVFVYMTNWHRHIKMRHPEMTLNIIAEVLINPDKVFKASKNSKEFYYQRKIDGLEYRVIVGHDSRKQKSVITAYSIDKRIFFDWHEHYCYYEKEWNEMENEERWKEEITAEYEQFLMATSV